MKGEQKIPEKMIAGLTLPRGRKGPGRGFSFISDVLGLWVKKKDPLKKVGRALV